MRRSNTCTCGYASASVSSQLGDCFAASARNDSPQGTPMNPRQLREFFSSADTWLLAGIGALAVIFFAMTFSYRPAAAFFPRVVTVIVAVLCLYELAMNVRTARAGQLVPRDKSEEAAQGIAWYHALLAIAAYCALIYGLGFVLATLVFLIGFPPLIGYRRWVVIVITAAVLTVLVEVSFVRFLHVSLPKGWLPTLFGW